MSPTLSPVSTVGRLAPSPTGGLHLGHARTFLIAWLAARQARGRVLLRIEDLDASRVRAEARAGILADLRWLGFDWDGDIYVQSQRIKTYSDVIEQLKRKELIYPCTCTRADVARAASAPHAEDEGPVYPGTCAGRTVADARTLGDRPFAWRFRAGTESIGWDDLVLGPTRVGTGGDFLVGRSDASPSYQLAVVADDADLGVAQVIRGDDLVPSTPRQLRIYEALGHAPPRFGHVPLVVGPDGRRLAKRDGSIKLATLRDAGVDPRCLIGWLARSCGWAEELRPTRPRDWIERFDLAVIPREPCALTSNALTEVAS